MSVTKRRIQKHINFFPSFDKDSYSKYQNIYYRFSIKSLVFINLVYFLSPLNNYRGGLKCAFKSEALCACFETWLICQLHSNDSETQGGELNRYVIVKASCGDLCSSPAVIPRWPSYCTDCGRSDTN